MFQDMSSELLYPVLPLFLKSIGFSILLIGLLEGMAEATIGLSKGYFGKRSDVSGKRLPFVQLGYALSTIAKTSMVFFAIPVWVFLTRTLDRLGKGIRTGARDAMLSDETTAANKGQVFGFHRSMDTVGAVLGPVLALIYLYFYPEQYTTLFYLAFVPGALAVLATFLIKERHQPQPGKSSAGSFLSFMTYWKNSSVSYRRVVAGFLAFALFNSSDVFLLLKLKESGISDTWVIGAYIFYNLVYAMCAYPLGILADRVGLKNMYVTGLVMFALVYFGMSFDGGLVMYVVLFAGYGVYSAATEGVTKAWISNLAERKDTATAIGFYSGFQSISAFIASSVAGLIWYVFGAKVTFLATAMVTAGVALYFMLMQDHVPADKAIDVEQA